MTVGHLESIGVAKVDLVLPAAGFSLGKLDRDARVVHAVTDQAYEVLVARGLKDVVVLDERGVVLEPCVALGLRFLVRLAEEHELELRSALDRVSRRLGALDLPPQDLAGSDFDRLPRSRVEDVAQHQRRLFEPRHEPQRRQVGTARDVAVSVLPVREVVPQHGGHVDIHREQVIARVDPITEHVIAEEVTHDPLTDQSALKVRERDDDSVDLLVADHPLQSLEVETSLVHPVPFWSSAPEDDGSEPARLTVVRTDPNESRKRPGRSRRTPAPTTQAGRGIHVDVDREEVVARLRAMRGDVVDEVLRVEALALQPAVHVDDREHDGVDRTRGNRVPEVVDRLELHRSCRVLDPRYSGPTSVARNAAISPSV